MSSSGSRPARYLALIYLLKPGQRDRLRHYENRALPVFRRHGGVFERIWTPARADGGSAPDPEAPDEIHLLRCETGAGEVVRKALLLRIEDVPLRAYFASGA